MIRPSSIVPHIELRKHKHPHVKLIFSPIPHGPYIGKKLLSTCYLRSQKKTVKFSPFGEIYQAS